MDFIEKIRSLAAGVKAALGGFFHKAGAFFSVLRGRFRAAAGKLLERVPPEKRKFVPLAAVAVFAAMFLFFLGVSQLSKGESDGREASVTARTPTGIIIPQDELFLPDEPDFVPGVLLEREQRPVWTADTAAPYWQDLLKNGERIWRDQIEKTVDEIMESVP
jgi:hypothetical protein